MAGNEAEGVGQRTVVQLSVDLFDDRVLTVVFLCLDQFDLGVGDEGVIAPRGEQLASTGGNGEAKRLWSRCQSSLREGSR